MSALKNRRVGSWASMSIKNSTNRSQYMILSAGTSPGEEIWFYYIYLEIVPFGLILGIIKKFTRHIYGKSITVLMIYNLTFPIQ